MWGGWYNDPILMDELSAMKKIYDVESEKKNTSLSPEVVFFADEMGFSELFTDSPQIRSVSRTRTNMGNIGAPYDSIMAEDASSVIKKYKAAVFPMPIPSDAGIRAMSICKENGIPYITATEEHSILTSDEIRDFLKQSGVHIYTEEKAVVYAGNGYIALHSATAGEKVLRLPEAYTLSPIFGAEAPMQSTNAVKFTLKENETALFRIGISEK